MRDRARKPAGTRTSVRAACQRSQCEHPPLLVSRNLDVVNYLARVHRRHDVLRPRLDPANGSIEQLRENADEEFLAIDVHLRPQAPAPMVGRRCGCSVTRSRACPRPQAQEFLWGVEEAHESRFGGFAFAKRVPLQLGQRLSVELRVLSACAILHLEQTYTLAGLRAGACHSSPSGPLATGNPLDVEMLETVAQGSEVRIQETRDGPTHLCPQGPLNRKVLSRLTSEDVADRAAGRLGHDERTRPRPPLAERGAGRVAELLTARPAVREVADGSVTLAAPASLWFCTGFGTFYGGVLSTLADSAITGGDHHPAARDLVRHAGPQGELPASRNS